MILTLVVTYQKLFILLISALIMKRKYLVLIISLVAVLIIIYMQRASVQGNVVLQEIRTAPLSIDETNAVSSAIETSEFIEDLPKSGVIALRFYSFDEQGRVWSDAFLIGREGLISKGEPDIYVAIHSKYLHQFGTLSLCDVIKTANANGDLAFHSDKSKVGLLVKYAEMVKHKECLG